MLKFFRDMFGVDEQTRHYSSDSNSDDDKKDKKIKLATCALFLEVAQSDEHFEENEREIIVTAMKKMFDLNDEESAELIKQSKEHVKKAVSVYEFTDVINNYFNADEKYRIVKNLWRLILADNKISKYEEHIIRTINNNFHLEHSDLIAAKMEVKEELGI